VHKFERLGGLIAKAQRERAELALDAVAGAAKDLVFGLARQFKDQVGIPQDFLVGILEEARKPMDALASVNISTRDIVLLHALTPINLSSSLLKQQESGRAALVANEAIKILEANTQTGYNNTGFSIGRLGAYERLGDYFFAVVEVEKAEQAYKNSVHMPPLASIKPRLCSNRASGLTIVRSACDREIWASDSGTRTMHSR
jgi:hypothetical protein